MEFGELLRQYREEAGLSQNALARAAGIDPTSLNRAERGKQGPPRKATLIKLVRALGWSLTDERAQRLFAAAERPDGVAPMPPATLPAPQRGRNPSLLPPLRRLRSALLQALDAVEAAGARIALAVTLLDRGDRAARLLAERHVPYRALTSYHDLGIEPVGSG